MIISMQDFKAAVVAAVVAITLTTSSAWAFVASTNVAHVGGGPIINVAAETAELAAVRLTRAGEAFL